MEYAARFYGAVVSFFTIFILLKNEFDEVVEDKYLRNFIYVFLRNIGR